MYGDIGLEMLSELSTATRLPPYRGDGIRKVVEEVNALYGEIQSVLGEYGQVAQTNQSIMASVVYHHASLLRNKRVILAYLHHRMQYLQGLRWEIGAILPEEVRDNASPMEKSFFSGYDRLLGDYMSDLDLNLTEDLTPPKDLFIQVRVVQDAGTIVTEDGDELTLRKNTTHFLRRSDVEHLIRQGVLEHIVH